VPRLEGRDLHVSASFRTARVRRLGILPLRREFEVCIFLDVFAAQGGQLDAGSLGYHQQGAENPAALFQDFELALGQVATLELVDDVAGEQVARPRRPTFAPASS
jgi:hypothetical protein